MRTHNVSPEMSAAVDRLESCLEAPVVPGELPEWSANARAACDALRPHLQQELADVHPGLYREIRAEDPGLVARTEELAEADGALRSQLADTEHALDELATAAKVAEPHESRIDGQVDAAVQSGLNLVIAIRKQETAIATWYVEAFQRDRGVAD